jgi:hypothetical protein
MAKESNDMPTSARGSGPRAQLHPLSRLAAESPEQLEPCLRRIAFRMARRRFAAWLGATSSLLVRDLEQLLLKRRIN